MNLSGPLSASLTTDMFSAGGSSSLNNNLIAYYDSDGEADRKGSNDLVYSQVAKADRVAVGHISYSCMSFLNGPQQQYVLTDPAGAVFNPNKSHSIAFWLRMPSISTNYAIFSKGGQYLAYMTSANEIFFRVGGTDIEVDPSMAVDTWKHFVLTYESGSQNAKVIWDGSNTTTVVTASEPVSNTDDFAIGVLTTGFHLTGLIDQFCYWDRVLSNDEASELYNSGDGLNFLSV